MHRFYKLSTTWRLVVVLTAVSILGLVIMTATNTAFTRWSSSSSASDSASSYDYTAGDAAIRQMQADEKARLRAFCRSNQAEVEQRYGVRLSCDDVQ